MVLLHNARDESVAPLFDLPESGQGALYTLDDLPVFRRLLATRFAPGRGSAAGKELAEAKSKQPLTTTKLAGRFSSSDGGLTLLDEQYVGYDRVLRQVTRAVPLFEGDAFVESDAVKRVFVFRGGPGSGKSAIALELQRELRLRGRTAVLASGSHAYTGTLRHQFTATARHGEVTRKRKAGDKLYQYFNSFIQSEEN